MVRIGCNSPVQGFTERGRRAAEVFGPQIMVWLASAGPQDAARYPDCIHLLRLDNWVKGEAPAAYIWRVSARIQSWRAAIPNIILIPGNEPDIEVNHQGEDIQQYAESLRAAFSGVKVANVPLSVANTANATYAGCDVRVCHSYFERQHPEDRGNPQFGASYVYAIKGAGLTPVYVTEFNVVQTNCPIDWPDRNLQVAQWLDDADGHIDGVALFIADAATDWASFDIGPEAAADILAKRKGPAPPPPDPPPPPKTGYSGNSRPLNGVTAVAAGWAAVAPKEVVDAYATYAQQIGYDPNLALGQSANETGWWTSSAYRLRRNMAGVGITGDAVLGPTWDTVTEGVQAHLALLNCYYGDGSDPWGQLVRFGFGGFRLGKQVLNEMDGVWAVPGTTYGEEIAANANQESGATPPLPPPIPPTPPPIVPPSLIPLSLIRDFARTRIGKIITDEGNPEFGECEQEFEEWCAGVGLPRTRYATALANGTILLQRGMIHTSMPPPIGAGLVFGARFDLNGHICAVDEWPFVITTYPGSVSRIDAKANGWYDSPGLIGWFIPEGAGIDGQEDDVFTVDGQIDDGRLDAIWYGTDAPTKTQIAKMPRIKGHGIPDRWEAELRKGKCLGEAHTGEKTADQTGAQIQYFANGWIVWYPDGTTTVC